MVKVHQTRFSELDAPFYFRCLITLARGDDGAIDEKELAFLHAQAAFHGCDLEGYLEEEINTDGMLGLPANGVSRETAVSIVRDAITLCYINGNMSTAQKDVLYALSGQLGVDTGEVDRVEDWLVRFWTLLEEGNRLLREPKQR